MNNKNKIMIRKAGKVRKKLGETKEGTDKPETEKPRAGWKKEKVKARQEKVKARQEKVKARQEKGSIMYILFVCLVFCCWRNLKSYAFTLFLSVQLCIRLMCLLLVCKVPHNLRLQVVQAATALQ